jgi:hypothetical protein
MWCIPKLTAEFKERMENLLELYLKPLDPREPVVCLDEKSKQLLEDSRHGMPMEPGKTAVRDYEYVRKGTANIFVGVEAKGGKHFAEVTRRRTKQDYAKFIQDLIEHYPEADCVHIVQDNLNTHGEKSLIVTFGKRKAKKIMERIKFHFTPKHASWLNMAEIEIGVLGRQCLKRRIPDMEMLIHEVQAWGKRQNEDKRLINWKFNKEKAKKIFPSLY